MIGTYSRVSVHRASRAPRPATLPRRSLPLRTHSNRQRCGEGFRGGESPGWLCPVPSALERLPFSKERAPLQWFCYTFLLVTPLLLPDIALGQYARAASKTSNSAKTDHAGRSLAAIDLAIIAAESGIMDVSLEALRRAVDKGPPVSSVDLGGLLSTNPKARRLSPSPRNNPAAQEAATAQVKLAKRLQRLHEIWTEHKMDPKLAYAAWKGLVLPAGRPNEAFAYGVAGPTSQSSSYSNVVFEFDQPKATDCGAAALVHWARLADKVDDLRQEIADRESLPGSATTVLLLKVILAQDESCPLAEAESLCKILTTKPKLLVDDPNAELFFGHAWKMLERVGRDSAAREKLVDAILTATKSHQRWAGNDWLQFLVAKGLRESLQQGSAETFRRYSDLAMSRYDTIRANNSDYVASHEASMFGEAAKRAFEAGHFKLGADCLRSQSLLATSGRDGSSGSNVLLDPTQAITKKLLKMKPAERYELLNDLVWNMPTLGLDQCARMNVTEHIPATFVTQLQSVKRDEPPSRQVAAAGARSISLLEWAMRDTRTLGKEAEILRRIAKLEEKGSDDAKLSRLVLQLAQDKPLDLALLTTTAEDGTKSLSPALGEGGRVIPLDVTVVQQALAQEDYRSAGTKLLDQLLKTALDQHQEFSIAWLRKLKVQADLAAGKRLTTHHQLKHWVVADDVTRGDSMAGRVPTSLWMQRGENVWGHEFGTHASYMMIRYPLQGDFSISFRSKAGLYEEGGTTCFGFTIEFLNFIKQLRFWGIGDRSRTSVETDTMKEGDFTSYRLTRNDNSLTLTVGAEEFQQKLDLISDAFPFFGMCSYHYRATTFDSLKVEGDVTVPRYVEMLSPSLLGWSAKFEGQRLPDIRLMPGSEPSTPKQSDKIEYDWQFVDGAIESVAPKEASEDNDSPADQKQQEPPRCEALVQYLRPLCDGEEISLEFYHEPGKFSLSPSLGRIAMLLSDTNVALHWVTADPEGDWTGIDDRNRVVDEQAEQLKPIKLRDNDWNQIVVRLDGEVVTLRVNGEDVYRRKWEAEAGRNFGLFHDPKKYHVRARNIRLGGDWPAKLPDDLFETKPG
jgi:hypothetical protein